MKKKLIEQHCERINTQSFFTFWHELLGFFVCRVSVFLLLRRAKKSVAAGDLFSSKV